MFGFIKICLVLRYWILFFINWERIWSMEGILNFFLNLVCFLIINWNFVMVMINIFCEFMKIFILIEKKVNRIVLKLECLILCFVKRF